MQPLYAYQRRILLVMIFIILAGLMLKLIDRQRQAVGFDIKGFLDGYKYSATVDTSIKDVNLSTSVFDTNAVNSAKSKTAADNFSVVNINEADRVELQKLPGIGPVLADRIVEYRELNGNFSNVDELMKVKGIGEKKLAKMKENIEF